MLGLSSLIADASHQGLALVQSKGADMDLVILKTRLLDKEVPIRRDESECVMTAVSRSCFALFLFQKLAVAKSGEKKRDHVFFVCLFFLSFDPFFRSKPHNDIFDHHKMFFVVF